MALITKLTKKMTFLWIEECQKAQELIKQKYNETLILIFPNSHMESHVYTNASLLVLGFMMSQNLTRKSDKPMVYAFKLLNITKQNYCTIERTLVKKFALHKFKHYLLGNKFGFYVNHMASVYLVNKPKVSRIIDRCFF